MSSPRNEEWTEKVRAYLTKHPKASTAEVARETGLDYCTTARRRKLIEQGERVAPEVDMPPVGVRTSGTEAEVVSHNPQTLADLIRVCKIDLSVWKVARWVANKWEVGTKVGKTGEVNRTPLYQIKAFLEPIPNGVEANKVTETIEWIRKNSPVTKSVVAQKPKIPVDDPHLLEIDPCDLHLDKYAWEAESGHNSDMKIASGLYLEAVKQLVRRASPFPIARILLVAGNDYLTSDSTTDTTTAGTPQSVDSRWQKSFQVGIVLQHQTIEYLRTIAPVDVMVVSGNHDTSKMFYLGCVLEAMYANTKDVRVINTPARRKYYRWGTTLLGFTHGHSEKHGALPLIMAGEAKQDWAETTHREIHLGHFHHKKETQFHAGNEIGPVRVRILPSLSATDAWHAEQGYVGAKRAAEAYLWSFKHGYTGHLSWGPDEGRKTEVFRG